MNPLDAFTEAKTSGFRKLSMDLGEFCQRLTVPPCYLIGKTKQCAFKVHVIMRVSHAIPPLPLS